MMTPLPPDRAIARAKSLHKRGDSDGARALLVDQLRRHPTNRRVTKALATIEVPQVPQRAPKLAARIQRLGELCAKRDFDGAITLGKELLVAVPDDPIVMTTLASALFEAARYDEAIPLFEAVIRRAPTFSRAWTGFGACLVKLGHDRHAVQALNQALALSPCDIAALGHLGSSLRNLSRHEEALDCFRAVEALDDGPRVQKNIGTTLLELGRPQEAAVALQKAVAMAPDYCAAHRDLSLVRKYAPGDTHLDDMKALFAKPDLPDDGRMHLSFALAKAFDDMGDVDSAFGAFMGGNRIRRGQIAYDPAAEAGRIDTLATLFRDHALTPLSFPPADHTPIFVVGMPRSGTSLCEEILARHPLVWGAGELETMRRVVAKAVANHNNRLSHDVVREVRARYLDGLRAIDAPAGFVTDKMPSNFRYTGFMRLAFPEAKIIHMRRQPAAVCWSMLRSYFAVEGHGYAYDMLEAADYYALYHRLMRLYEGLWPGTIHIQPYEKLTEDPEGEIRALLKACGLPFDPACLASGPSDRAVRTVSALQVRKAIYKGSSDAFRRYERHLAPMLERLAEHGLFTPAPA